MPVFILAAVLGILANRKGSVPESRKQKDSSLYAQFCLLNIRFSATLPTIPLAELNFTRTAARRLNFGRALMEAQRHTLAVKFGIGRATFTSRGRECHFILFKLSNERSLIPQATQTFPGHCVSKWRFTSGSTLSRSSGHNHL
jgi:hypothetical protein